MVSIEVEINNIKYKINENCNYANFQFFETRGYKVSEINEKGKDDNDAIIYLYYYLQGCNVDNWNFTLTEFFQILDENQTLMDTFVNFLLNSKKK
jgi:hypothetical protein